VIVAAAIVMFVAAGWALRSGGGGQKNNPYGPGPGKEWRNSGSRGAGYYKNDE